jgi:hypothetical protein
MLNPALAMPPVEIFGAVGEIAGFEVTLKDTPFTPGTDAVTVKAPVCIPRVTEVLAVPSSSVSPVDGFKVAASAGDTAKVTRDPGTGAPLASVT